MRSESRTGLVNEQNVRLLRQALVNGATTGNFYPSVYVVEIASTCNLRCVVCPNSQMTPSNLGSIDPELFQQIIQDIAPYCEFLMLYWMGEPLLHPNLPELLTIARSNIRGRIVLSSNMMVLDDCLSRSILSNVDILLCCIDRWDKRAYESVRRGADFDTVVANIESILAARGDDDSCEVVAKALDIAVESEEYRAFDAYWTTRGARPLLAWLNDWAGTLPQLRNAASLPIPRQCSNRVACADLWFKFVINWRGDVQMCCFDWDYRYQLGRHNRETDWIRSIWHSQALIELRRAHVTGDWAVNTLCIGCTTWGEQEELDAYVRFTEKSYFIIF